MRFEVEIMESGVAAWGSAICSQMEIPFNYITQPHGYGKA